MLFFKSLNFFLPKVCLYLLCAIVLVSYDVNALEVDTAVPLPDKIFLSVENAPDIKPRKSPFIVRSRLVTIDFGLIKNPEEDFEAEPDGEIKLILNAFQGLEFTAIIKRIEKNRSGSYSWYGELKDNPLSRVVLVVSDNKVFGNISKTGFSYQVRHISDGVHAVYEIDPTKFPPASEPITPDIKSNSIPLNRPLGNSKAHVKPHISGGYSDLAGGDAFISQDSFSQIETNSDAMLSTGVLTVPDSLSPSNSLSSSDPATQADDGSVIEVLVVYTEEARIAEGGVSAIESLIDLAESETNAAYSNSGVEHTISVVAKKEIDFSENDFSFSGTLSSAQSGAISGLHALRDDNGADLVAVLVKGDNSLCGLAYLMTTVSSSFEAFGYSVTQTNCATGNYTFGHEIGHNMAARHDRANDNTDGQPFDYNHGYVDTTNNFKTIMGTGANTRIQFFSNPNVLFGGAVTGVPEGNALAADNRLTFQNTAFTVANFRQSVSSTTPAFDTIVKFPNSQRVVSPYWQSDSESYTFIAVTHTSLSGMASQIGVVVRAIKNNGALFGSAQSFTVERDATERVFIVRSGHSSVNSTLIPDAKLITSNSSFQHGFLHINPVASNPENTVDNAYQDITMLSFWGTVVTESNTAGFAMEFIGDMTDSQATSILDNNAQVVGPAAP
ncbi:MAG: hypothetical protein F3741_09390 [Nitrospinae bacterium]|nr:hypothetical protein [Nitrospinota bacterium]